MSRTITSSMIPFVDLADSRKLECYIASNLPTTQIKNNNTNTYTPDWTANNLVLQSTIYLDAQDISTSAAYIWYCKYGTGTETQVATSRNLTINANLTDSSGIATYRCVATYQNLSATSQLVFTRAETGQNGSNGQSASIQAQYSTNGTTWVDVIGNDSIYIRFSYDNGSTWTSAMKIRGEDGTSLNLKGTAYSTTASLSAGVILTNLYSDSDTTIVIDKTDLVSGDAYLVNGYLCVFNEDTDNFICTGTIQGPRGVDGLSSYTHIRYATNASGANMSVSPSGKTYIGIAVTSTSVAPGSASSYTWSKYVGEDARSITLSANSQIFKVNKQGVISPATLTITGTPINTTITTWSYSIDGGANFVNTLPNGVTRSGNIVTITGASITANAITVRASNGTQTDIYTVYKVQDGTDGTPGSTGAAASLAFLSNEHINFIANSSGQISSQTITTNCVAYTGSTKVTPAIGTITGLPTGMTINAANITTVSNELVIPLVITNNATLGSNNSTSGVINIPITSPVSTNLKLNWSKVNAGTDGINAVSFQIYAPNGYLLSADLENVTLQTFAYDGATAINNATYVWYKLIDNVWTTINNATASSLTVARADVLDSQSYKCEMTYNSLVYTATATVEDKSDIYEAMFCITSSEIFSATNQFIVAYILTYNHNNEVDALLGPISSVAPTSPTQGNYWYSIDTQNESVTLMKYNGSAWASTNDTQELTYQWNIGGEGKVKVIKKSDISSSAHVQCEVVAADLGVVARCSQILYDSNDPIVSDTEPTVKVDGQIWIKVNADGTFFMYTWDSANNTWIVNEADTRQKIYTSKPNNYKAGDLWVVSNDYIPNEISEGSLLKAQHSNIVYADTDWISATRYDEDLEDINETLDRYNQYFTFTGVDGLQIRAKDNNGTPSRFYTQLNNNELGFYQDNDKVAYINNHKMNITEAEINRVTTPLLKIGNFSFVVESNDSMSIIFNG